MYKIHAFTGDNVTSNDTQVAELHIKDNSFDASNHVCCFNHTIQLSCKALFKPFTSSIASSTTDNDDMLDLMGTEDNDEDDNEDEDEGKELACNMDDDTDNDTDNDINELDALSMEEQANFLEATEAVKEAVTKVRMLPFMHMLLPYMTPSDSKAVLCNHSLNYNCIASMVLYLQIQPLQAQFDPT